MDHLLLRPLHGLVPDRTEGQTGRATRRGGGDVVAMDSRFELLELRASEGALYTLVYPESEIT